MATWGELLNEIRELQEGGHPAPLDFVRRRALLELHEHTGRNAILYGSGHLQKPQAGQNLVSISDGDIEGFMEVIYGLGGESLDLVLHSPGGTPDAANAIVQYLRSKFTDIRVIVPHAAMSAATMLACAADRIVMGRHSQLGPIDPQLIMQTEVGVRLVPAQAILDQFEMAKTQCDNEQTLAVWYPILKQYGPALLTQCENAQKHAEDLVGAWLQRYMFAEDEEGERKAGEAASALADHGSHLSHSRPLSREYLRDELELIVDDLEEDQELQDRALTVYHAMSHTFSATAAVKLLENQLGRSFVKMSKRVQLAGPPQDQDEED